MNPCTQKALLAVRPWIGKGIDIAMTLGRGGRGLPTPSKSYLSRPRLCVEVTSLLISQLPSGEENPGILSSFALLPGKGEREARRAFGAKLALRLTSRCPPPNLGVQQ